jgi:hypothetical protein
MYSGFFCEIFSASLIHLGILWDKNHIKIFCLEIWVKMIFGWPAFKIICNTPIFYQLSMSNWKQVSDYRLLGASSLYVHLYIWNLQFLDNIEVNFHQAQVISATGARSYIFTSPGISFNIYLAMWKYNCEPLWYQPILDMLFSRLIHLLPKAFILF